MEAILRFTALADTSGAIAGFDKLKTSMKNVSTSAGSAWDSLKNGVSNATTYGKVIASEFGDKAKSSIESLSASIGDFAKNPLGAMQSGVTGLIGKMGPFAIGLGGIATGAAAAGAAIFKLAASAADEMEALENLSHQTGMSTQDLQALKQIAAECGMEGLDLGRTIGMLNAQLGDGKGDFIDALNKMGIEMTDIATGKPKDAVTLLDEMRVQLLALPEGAERAQAAQDALGGRLKEMIPILMSGNGSLREMMDTMKGTGVVTDDLTKEKLLKFDEQMDKLGRTWTGFMNQLKGWLGGVMATLFEWFGKVSDSVGWLADKFGKMTDKLGFTKPKVESVTQATKNLTTEVKQATETTTKFNFSQEQQEQFAQEAADKIKKQREEIEKLREATQAALNPMDALAKKIQEQVNIGFARADVVKLYSDQIIESARKQQELSGKLSDNNIALLEAAYNYKLTKDRVSDFTGTIQINTGTLQDNSTALVDNAKYVNELKEKKAKEAAIFDVTSLGVTKNSELLLNNGEVMTKVAKSGETAMTGLGNVVSTTLTNMTQSIAKAATEWMGPIQGFAAGALSAIMEGFLNPWMEKLTEVGNIFSNWLTGLLSGKGGGGLFGNIIGALTGGGGNGVAGQVASNAGLAGTVSGWLGIGGSSAGVVAGTTALTGSAASAAYGTSGMIGGMSGVSSSAAAGGSGFLSSLGAFATNPWTIGIAAAGALGYLGYQWATGPNSYQALAEETKRDLGVSVSDGQVKAFMDAVGIPENKAWDYRVQIEQSPMYMAYLLALGKKPHTKWEAFQKPLAWGAVKDMWAPYNSVYSNWCGNEQKLTAIPWSNMLIPNAKDPITELGVNPWDIENVPQYQKGIDYVPSRHLAILDPGEAVLTAEQNKARGVTVIVRVEGPVYGLDHLDAKIEKSIDRTLRRGGLRKLARA